MEGFLKLCVQDLLLALLSEFLSVVPGISFCSVADAGIYRNST